MAMGKDQRDAIRRALNEDAEKLIQEGDPNDSQLRRLRREIDEVNRLFDEFERLAAEGKENGKRNNFGLTLLTPLHDIMATVFFPINYVISSSVNSPELNMNDLSFICIV